jgi:phosphoribosyl-dephospho-CoA transferase
MARRGRPVILRPHDLLRVVDPSGITDAAPTWARTTLSRTPWVVVRRAEAPNGFAAVGLRGEHRSQRHAMVIPHDTIGAVARPEDLTADAGTRDVPAFHALTRAGDYLDECAMPWGPTGSVGFELATGAVTVTADSDLDLVVRAPVLTPAVLQRLSVLRARLQKLFARVDCQVETSNGAIALAELTSTASTVLVRSRTGPALIAVAELFA